MVNNSVMADMLREAYAHPERHNVFYAGAAVTGSERLNALGQWDWRPDSAQGVETGGTLLFPLALGCAPRHTSEGKMWIERLITDPAQVANFVAPDLYSGYAGEVLRRYQALRDAQPEATIGIPDVQSPLGVAELLWDDSFYSAMLEEPEAVHALLTQITDFIIAFVAEVQRIAGEHVAPCAWPSIWSTGPGTMVADDTMSLISPAAHAEFSLPYLNRMAAACGPLYYHSCTWREPYFENIHAVKNVRAYNWNPGNSDDPARIMREFGGQAVLAPHLVIDMHLDNDVLKLGRNFDDEYAFFRYLLDNVPENGCTYFYFSNICAKGEIIERIYALLHERGYTPQANLKAK